MVRKRPLFSRYRRYHAAGIAMFCIGAGLIWQAGKGSKPVVPSLGVARVPVPVFTQTPSVPAASQGNVEYVMGGPEPVVFRVGTHYVSTKSVDLGTGDIVMPAYPALDDDRIKRQLGVTVPDFAYQDLDGNPHRLGEFRGKYLLLDFWGIW